MNTGPLKAFVSLHDVMPETFALMEDILGRLRQAGIGPITLLVVPGKSWQPAQLDRLRELAAEGHPLAAHGWAHRVDRPTRLYHRIHSALISRNVAEHLALNPPEILDLMRRSARWFPENNLPVPNLYVPPAWALGPVQRNALNGLPFTHIEVLRGMMDTRTGRLHRLPLVGFEVDTWWREAFVRSWNALQIRSARHTGQPLRVGLHPHDFQLRMAGQLEALMAEPGLTRVDLPACCG